MGDIKDVVMEGQNVEVDSNISFPGEMVLYVGMHKIKITGITREIE